MIQVICKNTGGVKDFPKGVTLNEIVAVMQPKLKYPILGALVNNRLRDLDYDLFKPKTVEFIDITHPDGRRMYSRSTLFVLHKAVRDLYPNAHLRVEHSLPAGSYCEIDGLPREIDEDMIKQIAAQMKKIADANIPFVRRRILTEEAIEIFKENGLNEKVELFETRSEIYTSVYQLGDTYNYFYGNILPSTSYVTTFQLEKYYKGIYLKVPKGCYEISNGEKYPKESKLFKIFREHVEWLNILKIPYVGDLNRVVMANHGGDLIKISEALHEKKIASIADEIFQRREEVKIVLISGPSSSGKTTFSKRLSVQLQVLGFSPVQISLDNYFVDREHTPLDEHGDYNFECLEAIDVPYFNQQLTQLLNGEQIEIPNFDFKDGKRFFSGQKLQMSERSVLVIEGIHGLNPELTRMIADKQKYSIFVSALTHMSIDTQNPIPSTDNRLIRRIVRDNLFRGYDALSTIQRWESVRRGEEMYIFPYQENADVMFNSALPFELAVLKKHAEPVLKEVPETHPEYAEAVRLLKFLSYFKSMPDKEIPPTSILLEFLGGSSFVY